MPDSPSQAPPAGSRPEQGAPPAAKSPGPQIAGKDRPAKDAPPSPRKKRQRILLFVLLGVAALVGGLIYWLHARHFESTDDAFIAAHVTSVAAQVPGRVETVLVDDNQLVREGDVLVRIDPADYQARLEQAQASLDAARKGLDEATSQLAVARATAQQSLAQVASAQATAAYADKERARYEQLFSQRVVAQEARDNAATTARTAAASLEAAQKKYASDQAQVALAATRIETAKAQVEQAQAALDQAALNLAYTEVRARVAGRVTNKNVEPGDYVQAGQSFMSLVQPDVWVVANFKETQLTYMRPGQSVEISVDAFPDHPLTGHVDSIQRGSGAAFSLLPPENATGNYVKVVQRVPVKILLHRTDADKDLLLAPGMSVVPTVRVR